MANEALNQLLLRWREQYDEMQKETASERAKLEAVATKVADLSEPYKQVMLELYKEIEPLVMQMGSTYNDLPGVIAKYRGGYFKITYNKDKVDVVLGFLTDIAPNAAEQLREARKITAVPAKVTIEAREE